jgi:hypothetical protein
MKFKTVQETTTSVYLTTGPLELGYKLYINRIGGVMVNVFASSAVDRGFEPLW